MELNSSIAGDTEASAALAGRGEVGGNRLQKKEFNLECIEWQWLVHYTMFVKRGL